MKARSVILTHTQHPAAIFGMPPILAVLAMSAGAVPVAMIVLAAVTVPLLYKARKMGEADRHVETVFLTALSFWGLSSRRWLLTGAFPKRSRGGARS
jgi:type IV secretory pathway VirB3-like protein